MNIFMPEGLDNLKEKSLSDFLTTIDNEYIKTIARIDLFDPKKTSHWTQEQKKLFVYLFYHARGHFYKFLWYMGARSSSQETKDRIIENIKEEFSETDQSHDTLYLNFARSLGLNLEKEIYEEKFYRPFLREFDRNHLRWIVEASSEQKLVALFSAYERLDNIDYSNLLHLAKRLGVTDPNALLFFTVHSNAKHFDRLYNTLDATWKNHKDHIVDAFKCIYENQANMWNLLSKEIENKNF